MPARQAQTFAHFVPKAAQCARQHVKHTCLHTTSPVAQCARQHKEHRCAPVCGKRYQHAHAWLRVRAHVYTSKLTRTHKCTHALMHAPAYLHHDPGKGAQGAAAGALARPRSSAGRCYASPCRQTLRRCALSWTRPARHTVQEEGRVTQAVLDETCSSQGANRGKRTTDAAVGEGTIYSKPLTSLPAKPHMHPRASYPRCTTPAAARWLVAPANTRGGLPCAARAAREAGTCAQLMQHLRQASVLSFCST